MKIAYLRTDFANRLKAGGSVAHILGVAQAMQRQGHEVHFFSTSYLTGYPTAETHVVSPGILRYAIFGIGNALYNLLSLPSYTKQLRKIQPDAIYHRYSILSNVAVRLARKFNIPLILEYNSSEVWIAKNWHIPLYSLKAAAANEERCLREATIIVVVSQPLKDDLVKRGVPAKKILVNPNGADTNVYCADNFSATEKQALRTQLGIGKEKVIVGFIGTFGQWHGVGDIVEAAHILKQEDNLTDSLHFLLLGDGITMPDVQAAISRHNLATHFTLTGLLPQADAPRYLSLFDIALNPTTPNKDGSEFFGSPTKIFEYMAMCLPVISSSLGQMRDIFKDGTAGILYPPTDVQALAHAIHELATKPALRKKLGAGALAKVKAEYTWDQNIIRTLNFLAKIES